MVKKAIRKSKPLKKFPRFSKKTSKIPRKSTKTQKVKEFLKGKVKYVPHILTGVALTYLTHQLYNMNPMDIKLIKFNILNNADVYKKLDIKKDSSLEDVKKILHKCYREMHPDRSKNESTRKIFELCIKLRDFLRKERVEI